MNLQVNTSFKEIFRLAYPVIIGAFANTILNITDTAFLGRVGETELGASAVGGVLYFVFAMIGIAIGVGAQIMIARRAGENKKSEIGEIFFHSFLLLTVLGIFLFLLLRFLSPWLLTHILRSQDILTACIDFLTYRSFGIVFIMMATAYRSLFVGISRPKVYGTYAFLMAGLNILFCYAFIFGHFGMPAMGIAGAGLASSIAELLSFIYLLVYSRYKTELKEFKLYQFTKVDARVVRRLMSLSTPLVIQNLLSMGAWFIFFVFIERIGSRELASSNIVRAAYMLSMTPIWGFSVSVNSMISNVIGQQKGSEVMLLLRRTLLLSFLATGVMISLNLFFPDQVLGIFTSDAGLISDSRGILMIVNVSMFFFAFALVCISAVSGTGATRMALYIEIAAIFIYLLYIYCCTFIFKTSAEWVWLSEVLYWGFTGAVSYAYLRSLRWKKIQI